MRVTAIILSVFLISCKTEINVDDVEMRQHHLSYYKGTEKLVTGEVIRKFDGSIVERTNYKDGKPVGSFEAYGPGGEITAEGYGVDLMSFQSSFQGIDFSNSVLSIIKGKAAKFASAYVEDSSVFNDRNLYMKFATFIFNEYKHENLEQLILFCDTHEYQFSPVLNEASEMKVDTIPDPKLLRIKFR